VGSIRKGWLIAGMIVGLLGPAAVAQANTNTSVNWSGYAVHRAGVRFRRVSGQWRVPAGSCLTGYQGFSAFWLGLGGYRLNSQSLEQVGIEFDCNAIGQTQLSVWYELVPAPARTVRMTVRPGDLISARVVARGIHVTVALTDRTRSERFHKRMVDHHMDLSSAEWIAEAPSECMGVARCSVLPLADFGAVSFVRAYAQTYAYRSGGINSHHWNRTRILLANTEGRRYVSGSSVSSHAIPSKLSHRGRTFTITYSSTGTPSSVPSGSTSVAGPRTRVRSASAGARPPLSVLGRQG
jgi:hypothetical protein